MGWRDGQSNAFDVGEQLKQNTNRMNIKLMQVKIAFGGELLVAELATKWPLSLRKEKFD